VLTKKVQNMSAIGIVDWRRATDNSA